MLSLAARHADIVGLQEPTGNAAGTASAEAVEQQLAWIREAAGERYHEIEIQSSLLAVRVTDDRRRGAEDVAAWMASLPPTLRSKPTADQVLGSLRFLVGSVDEIVDDLRARRDRYDISYVTVLGDDVDAFSPVVARLAAN